jgi:hypothetical protein
MSVEDGGTLGGLEAVDNQLKLNTSIRGEDVLGLDLGELERPVVDDNNLGSQIGDGSFVGCLVAIDSLFGEIARDVEVIIGDKEVGVRLLNVALDWDLLYFVWDLGEISTVLKNGRIKILERGNVV